MTQTKFKESFEEYLKREYKGPFVGTDIIIRYKQKSKEGIVLIERKHPPHGIALPGGMAERMTFIENAIKEAKEETGLDVIIDKPYHRPFTVFSNVRQDPRTFIASVAYTAQGYGRLKPHKDEDAKSAEIYSHEELEKLLKKDVWAFPHHKKIVAEYVRHIRRLNENKTRH